MRLFEAGLFEAQRYRSRAAFLNAVARSGLLCQAVKRGFRMWRSDLRPKVGDICVT